ncbi:DUF3427 domain-containing protein [Pontibacillus yanchengensis]|uniref:Helicase n=1 Tax=Pontibacillus yanchengensis Y32 TaxID=1385514 RepID=A0A0A2TJL4_9BACI|nr:DEAD/DEAH box helicase [Pontibacillus yanchengensis]KGP74266.1 helicase [Pontibacillus yanchengensis Y32]
MQEIVQKLEASLHRGFINQQYQNAGSYTPKLLINNATNNETVLSTLLEELENCESFIFSVAFITESGLAMLKAHLLDLHHKGITGRILTSTFLKFNNPKVFKELMKLDNVEVRLTDRQGFHSKGYIFNHSSYHSLIVGSSNLTSQALKVNYEWNIKLTSHENGELVNHFYNQFEEVWDNAIPLTKEWIEEYEKSYVPEDHPVNQVREIPSQYQYNAVEEALKIVPNKMQQAALEQISKLRQSEEKRGLVVSATGTGKTYLSAFDVRNAAPKKMLFIVHREQILQKAKSDFQRVLGGLDEDFGILSGSDKQTNARYLFATIQTISKEENLKHFDPDEFNYILIDEVHKAGAQSYHRVIDYFDPEFLMGMTATPERTDGFNIYELFDYNIAYEIRLQEALEEDMLCPFHYFGVTDYEYDGKLMDETANLSRLANEDRVQHVMEKVEYYGHSGEEVKGLIFCSRKEEAKELSSLLNDKGYRTVALTGDNDQQARMEAVSQLENGLLDYILTVDIFNEGVDIPCINQVVMLRQTQSSIIFVQQLGRGLRKFDSKEFVTVIDFIGNYKNNYLIPIALSGDYSQNKDNVRRRMRDTSYLKGISTINFEEVAKQEIFKAIDDTNLTEKKIIKDYYTRLKNKLGRTPFLYDFLQYHSIDPEVIIGQFQHYHKLLTNMKEDVSLLTDYEQKVLTMISFELMNGKRIHELVLLQLVLENKEVSYAQYINSLKAVNKNTDEQTIESVRRMFDLSFFTKTDQKNYGHEPIISMNDDNVFRLNKSVWDSLQTNEYYKKLVQDVLKTGYEKNKHYDNHRALSLYQKYSRKDVCRLLNWDKDEKGTMFGYTTRHNTSPVFVTYKKDDSVQSSVNYEDELLDPETLLWYSKSKRKITSPDVQKLIKSEEYGNDIHIFIKKSDGEGTDFYYLGTASLLQETIEQTTMEGDGGSQLPVVTMLLTLEQPIEHNLYMYLQKG